MSALTCIVVTPEETALTEKADFIALPLFDGEIGIAPSRSPMIGRLGFGEMRLKTDGKTTSYYVDGGFVQVNENTVSVLTSRAIPATQIDVAVAQEQLDHAQKQLANTPELLDIRDRAVTQARAMLRTAQKAR